ncbi:Beige/BEACH domain containing protein [Entamoeba marina]
MNFFKRFKSSREKNNDENSKEPTTLIQTELIQTISKFQDSPTINLFTKCLNEILTTYLKDPTHFPNGLDFTLIINWIFENIKTNIDPDVFIQYFFTSNYSELSVLNILGHHCSSQFNLQQIGLLLTGIVNSIRFVIHTNPCFDLVDSPTIFPIFEHHSKFITIPSVLLPPTLTPTLQVISNLLTIIEPFCSPDSPDLSFADVIIPQLLVGFIDHYYRYIPLQPKALNFLIKKTKKMCIDLVNESTQQNSELVSNQYVHSKELSDENDNQNDIENKVNGLMKLIVCLTQLYPESPVDYPGLFPYSLSHPFQVEYFTYYYNVIQSTQNLDFIIPMAYQLSEYINDTTKDVYFFFLRKIHLFAHSISTTKFSFFKNIFNQITSETNPNHWKILITGLVQLLPCMTLNESTLLFDFIKIHSKNTEVMESIVDGLTISQLSKYHTTEFILDGGISYYLRLIATNATGVLKKKILRYLIELTKDVEVLRYFQTTEPQNFFSKCITNVQDNEEFEMMIELLTLLLIDDCIEQINQTLKYIKILPHLETMDEIEYRIHVMKLWKLRISIASQENVEVFSHQIEHFIQLSNGTSHYFEIMFETLSSLKENEYGSIVFRTFLQNESTFKRAQELTTILGDQLYVFLRNISLKQMVNIIDEPMAIILMLKLLVNVSYDDSDKILGNLLLPLTEQSENIDILSHTTIPELLLPFVIHQTKAGNAEFLLKRIISYHTTPSIIEKIIKHIHSTSSVQSNLESVLISSFETLPSPTYFAEINAHHIRSITVPLSTIAMKSFTICTYFNILNFPEYATPTVPILTLTTGTQSLEIHATPLGIAVYFSNSSELLQFPIREKYFHTIIVRVSPNEITSTSIFVDGKYIGDVLGKWVGTSTTDLIVKSTEQAKLRIGNIITYKSWLNKEEVLRFTYCGEPDLLPYDIKGRGPLNIKKLKEIEMPLFFIALHIKTLEIHSDRSHYPSKVHFSKIKHSTTPSINRCVHGKTIMQNLGGSDIILLLLSLVKDDESALHLLELLSAYLSKNSKGTRLFLLSDGLSILFSILNTKHSLFESCELVGHLLDVATDHEKEIFTAKILVDKIVLNVAFWKKCSYDVLAAYLARITLVLASPHKKISLKLMMECNAASRLLPLYVLTQHSSIVHTALVDLFARLLAAKDWKIVLTQVTTILVPHILTSIAASSEMLPIYSASTLSEHINDSQTSFDDTTITDLSQDLSQDISQDKPQDINQERYEENISAAVLVVEILVKHITLLETVEKKREFIEASIEQIEIESLLSLLTIVSNEYVTTILRLLKELISVRKGFDEFVRCGGCMRLVDSLRSIKRIQYFTSEHINMLMSVVEQITEMKQEKTETTDLVVDSSIVLLLCCVENICKDSLEIIINTFWNKCTKPEGRTVVSMKMYSEVVYHVMLHIVHRQNSDEEHLLEKCYLMYDCSLNEAQRRSVQQVANKVHGHYLHVVDMLKSPFLDAQLFWTFFTFLADMHRKYVLTRKSTSQRMVLVYATARLLQVVLQQPLPLTNELQTQIITQYCLKQFIHQFERRPSFFEETYKNINVLSYYMSLLNTLSLTSSLITTTNTPLTTFTLSDLQNFVTDVLSTILPKPYHHNYLHTLKQHTSLKLPSTHYNLNSTSITRTPPSRSAYLHWRTIVKKYTSPTNLLSFPFQPPLTAVKLLPIVTPSFIHSITAYSSPKNNGLPTTIDMSSYTDFFNSYTQLLSLVPYVPPTSLIDGIHCIRIKETGEYPGTATIIDDSKGSMFIFQYYVKTVNKSMELVDSNLNLKNANSSLQPERILKELRIILTNSVISKMKYMYEDKALEIIGEDGCVNFFVFKSGIERGNLLERGNKTITESKLNESTKLWSRGLLSTYEYLAIINHEASRSIRVLSQYPIYPWVIRSYDNTDFRLSDRQLFRDLTTPIALQQMGDERDVYYSINNNYEEKQCHFNCCLSSPSSVLRCLFRLQPYSSLMLAEMSGRRLEVDSRMFTDVKSFYHSSVIQSRLELIPEFYSSLEVFLNLNNLKGDQGDVGDVILPPWGKQARMFVQHMREALESTDVSLSLHEWIDLVFGVLQQSVERYNVYSNEYTKDSEMEDDVKEIVWKTMGSIPIKVFNKLHVKRVANPRLAINCFNPHAEVIANIKSGITFISDGVKFLSYHEKMFKCRIDKEILLVRFNQVKSCFQLIRNEQVIASLYSHAVDINDFIVLENGNGIVYGCESGEAVLILRPFTKSIEIVPLYGITSPITSVAYCNDFHTIVIATENGMIYFYDENGNIRHTTKQTYPVNKLLFSQRNGDLITLSYFDKKTHINGYTINAQPFANKSINAIITTATVSNFMSGMLTNLLILGSDGGEIMLHETDNFELLGSCYAGTNGSNLNRSPSKVLSIQFLDNYTRLVVFVEQMDSVNVLELK